MSTWSSDLSNKENIVDPDLQWKVKVKLIDDTLRKLKQETDNMAQKFIWVKSNNGSYEGFQNWIHKVTDSCNELTNYINDLIKIIPKTHNHEYMTKNAQVNKLSERVQIQVRHIKNLSSDIQMQMESNFNNLKLATSSVSNEPCDVDVNRLSGDSKISIQMSSLEDPKLKQAFEEQCQMENLTKDVLQLESLMVKMSEMVYDQGEMVEKIEIKVVEASENVEEGNVQLSKAIEQKKKIYKKKIFIIGIVIIILAIIALIIGLSIKG